jgi:hypothetical protein
LVGEDADETLNGARVDAVSLSGGEFERALAGAAAVVLAAAVPDRLASAAL